LAKNYIIENLKKQFRDKQSFSVEELFDFYRHFEPDLKETTFRWRIYELKVKKIIVSISRGMYTLSYKPFFRPEVDEIETKIYKKLKKQFPDLKQCIWNTKFINEFMLHIPSKYITILEVEKVAIEPVYELLKEQKIRNIYIEPEEKEIERYVYETDTAIILQSLISKAPTQKVKQVSTSTIEKIIVDLYCDKKLLGAYQGSELTYIINNAYNRYAIDFTKMFAYAKRRRREADLMEFLIQETDIPQSIFND
jgi:hypothetical protein